MDDLLRRGRSDDGHSGRSHVLHRCAIRESTWDDRSWNKADRVCPASLLHYCCSSTFPAARNGTRQVQNHSTSVRVSGPCVGWSICSGGSGVFAYVSVARVCYVPWEHSGAVVAGGRLFSAVSQSKNRSFGTFRGRIKCWQRFQL